jgi:hypothetical protein
MTQPKMTSIYGGYWHTEPDDSGWTWVPYTCIGEGDTMATNESELYERIMEVLYDVGLLEPVSIDSIAEEAVENYVGYIVGSGRNHSRDDADNFLHAVVADAITQALDAADCGDICACC